MTISITDEIKARILDHVWEDTFTAIALVSPNNTFIRANQEFCDILGRSESEIKGKSWMSFTHPEDIDGDLSMTKELKDPLSNKTKYGMVKRYIHKLGHEVPVYLKVINLYNPDNGEKVLLFISQAKPIVQVKDLTEEESIELLKLKQDAWQTNAKWIIAAIIGVSLTIFGALTHNDLIQNAGLGGIGAVFGGYVIKGKK